MSLRHDEVLTSALAWLVAVLSVRSQSSFPTQVHNKHQEAETLSFFFLPSPYIENKEAAVSCDA